jgi:hypothetical protein
MRTSKTVLGLALGFFLASFHVVWSILVATKLAKPFLDWLLALHHIEFEYTVASFNLNRVILLVLVTFVVGFIYGWVIGFFLRLFAKK